MTKDIPTVQQRAERTNALRAMLQYGLDEEDLISAVREMARLVLEVYEVINTLPEIRESMASTQKLVLDFIADQMRERRDRNARELEVASTQAQKAREKLIQTDEKIKRMDFPIKYDEEIEPLSNIESAWMYFVDKVLPYLLVAFAFFVLQAVWELVRARLSNP